MTKRFQSPILILLMITFIFSLFPNLHSFAAEDESITVTSITVVPGSGVLYKELSDTYVLGPNSTMEIKFTTQEKIIGQNNMPRFTLVSAGFSGAYEERHSVFAKYERMEGEKTIVFKVFCGENAKSASINIARSMSLSIGDFLYEKIIPVDGGKTTIVQKKAWRFNLDRVSSLSKFIYRNEWPVIKLSPEPDSITTGKVSNGLSADSLIVDLNDPILDPSDFQIRYELWDLSQTNVKTNSDWFQCKDRNFIEVPVSYRNKEVGLFLEVRDALGNYRPYSYNYMTRQSGGYCRMEYMQSNILSGGSMNEFFIADSGLTPEEKAKKYADAKQYFTDTVKTEYDSQYNRKFADIAVFIFSPKLSGLVNYSKTRGDIDIEKCGFQWSTNKDGPDPARSVQRFNQRAGDENIIPSVELVPGWGYSEGYWCIIKGDYDDIAADAVYYLHLRIADKVSGGAKWEPLYYIFKKPDNTTGMTNVKFMRDNTPPEITFSEDPVNEPGIVTITLEDNFQGVGYTQLGISTTSGNTESSDVWNGVNAACFWYDIFPTPHANIASSLTKTEDTPGNKKITFKVNKTTLPTLGGVSNFYLHVRIRDKSWDSIFGNNWTNKMGHATKSVRLDSSGFISPGASPDCRIIYSTTSPTNKPVTATISTPPGCRVMNNGGSNAFTFLKNGSFTFKVRDSNGGDFEFVATVNNIDLNSPTITLAGPRTYSIYQGLAFDFVEPGFLSSDAEDGDLKSKVNVSNNINIYKGGYYEVIYTVTDNAGNTAREIRGVSVYETNGINMFINDMRVRGGETINGRTLNFKLIGLQSEKYTLSYLPGKQKSGAFKAGGTSIANKTVTLPAGWYTFYVQDEERTTLVVPVLLK